MKVTILFLFCLIFTVGACTTPSTSSGFISKDTVIPKKVEIIPFEGDLSISTMATELFTNELRSLEFEIVENPLDIMANSVSLAETRIKLKEQFGIEGIFYGDIRTEGGPMSDVADTIFNIRLIDVETGRIVWSAEVRDPRSIALVFNRYESAKLTVKNAVKILKKDFKLKFSEIK